MTTVNPVGWFDIYVSDLARATLFYQKVLEVKFEPLEDPTGETKMMCFPASKSEYGTAGALVKNRSAMPGLGGTMVYFSVEDCARTEASVAGAGGRVIRSKFSIGQFGWV